MRETNLSKADLSEAYLVRADLSRANLREVNLSRADLEESNLFEVYLFEAKLIDTVLDGATITNSCLWETQRAGWSIKNIICEAIYWDWEGVELTQYAPGEFERLYADTFKIKLHYDGGIDLIEIATLPALIKQIEDKYPGCTLHFQSIQDDAGGATVTIAVDNLGKYEFEALEATAQQTQSQLRRALQENEQLRGILNHLTYEVIPTIVRQCMTQINVGGNVGNLIGTVSGGDVQMIYTPNDLADIRSLITDIFDQRKEIGLTPEKLTELEAEVQTIQTQLAKQTPNHSIIKEAGKTIRNILEGAVGSTLASGWLPALQQLLA